MQSWTRRKETIIRQNINAPPCHTLDFKKSLNARQLTLKDAPRLPNIVNCIMQGMVSWSLLAESARGLLGASSNYTRSIYLNYIFYRFNIFLPLNYKRSKKKIAIKLQEAKLAWADACKYLKTYLLIGEVSLLSSESCFDEVSPPINSWNPSTFTGGALTMPIFLHADNLIQNSNNLSLLTSSIQLPIF